MIESVVELPFNRFLGIQLASSQDGSLQLPAGEQYLNHIGTVHAAAQLALAEASAGEFLLRFFGPNAGIVPVVRRLEAKFRKPANGKITSTIRTSSIVLDDARTDLENKGRCVVTIDVDLHDEADQHTLSASIDWFIAKDTHGSATPSA